MMSQGVQSTLQRQQSGGQLLTVVDGGGRGKDNMNRFRTSYNVSGYRKVLISLNTFLSHFLKFLQLRLKVS